MPTRRGIISMIVAFLVLGGLTAAMYQKLGTIPGVAAVFCSLATPALSEVGGCLIIGDGNNTSSGDTALPQSPAPATIIREEIVIREEAAPASSSSGLIGMLRKVDEALNAVIFNQQTITYIQEDIADLEDEVARLRRQSGTQDSDNRDDLSGAIDNVTVDTVIQGSFTLDDIRGTLGNSLLFVNWLGEVSTSTLNGSHVTADSLDFTEFRDALTVDATTTFDLDTNAADLNFDNSTLFIDSSLNRIGIGTSTPLYALDVVGSARLTDSLIVDAALTVLGLSTLATTTITDATITSGLITDLVATNATSTNLRVTSSATLATTTITDATITSGTVTDLIATNSTSTNLVSTNATSTNSFITNLLASFGTFGELTVTGTSTLATTSITHLTVGDSVASGVITASRFVASDANATSTFGNISASGDVSIDGDLTVTGDSYVVGTSSASTLVINSSIGSDLIPTINATYDIGSPAFFWNDGYFDTITANNISAASTSISGTQSNNFTINSDNASADAESISLIFYRGVVVPNALITWDATRDRFDFNQPTFIQNDSSTTTVTTLDVRGTAGQSADIFNVASSSGTSYFDVSSSGAVSISTLSNGVLVTDNTGTISASTTLSAAFIQDAFVQNTGDTMTGTLILPNSGLQIGASVPFSDSSGTLTLQNVDALDATTEATIESAIDTLANLASAASLATVGTITTGTWNADAVDISDYSNLAVSAPGLELSGDSVALSSGYEISTTASTTAWNNFFNTPSTRITAGTGLTWTGNTIDVDDDYVLNTGDEISGNLVFTGTGANIALGSNFLSGDGDDEGVFVDSDGNVGIGTTTPNSKLSIYQTNSAGSYDTLFSINSFGTATSTLKYDDGGYLNITSDNYSGFTNRTSSDLGGFAAAPEMSLGASRGNPDTPTATQSGDDLGYFNFQGYGTSAWRTGASIQALAMENYTNTSVATDLRFFTVPTGTSTLAERMRITSAGNVGIGTTTPSTLLDIVTASTAIAPQVSFGNSAGGLGYVGLDRGGNSNRLIIGVGSHADDGQAFTLDTGGNVGIGTTTPNKRLQVFDTVSDDQFRISYDATRYADFQVDSAGDLIVNAQGGDVRYNDENIWTCSGGSCPASSPTGTGNIIVERDVIIHGKLDVATIDPIYRIGGVNYATFGVSAIGVKEEASETIKLTERNEETGYYEYRISWNDLAKASDLWLFYQVTDFGVLWEKLAVTLTAGFDGRVFYTKDFKNNALVIQATAPGEVSARFMANRFDWMEWSNIRPDQDTKPHFDLEEEK